MAELAAYNDYEREYLQLTSQLPMRINGLIQYESNPDDANGEIRRIESDMMQAKQRLGDMELEARGLTEPTRKELGNKIRTYKEGLAVLTRDLNAAKSKFSRSALMAGGGSNRPLEFDKSGNQRDRMAQATERLQGATSVLDSAHVRLEETIEVGAGIMTELDRNRETLHRIRGNVDETSGTLDVARRILRGMAKREIQNKIAVGVFAVVMIGIIALVIYFVVKGKQQDPAPQ